MMQKSITSIEAVQNEYGNMPSIVDVPVCYGSVVLVEFAAVECSSLATGLGII